MQKIFIFFAMMGFSLNCFAVGKQVGIGAIIGAPTGVSAAYKLSPRNTIDAALGWSLADDVNIYLHSTYLFLKPSAFQIDEIDFDIYYGIGFRLKDRDTKDDDDDFRLGARAPLGVHYMFNDPSIEIFAEVALILDVIEKTDVDFNLALGARFWF